MRLPLPGLRGDDPLGFLAAMGLVALSEQREIPDIRLAWDGRSAPEAVVEADVASLEELGEHVRDVLLRLRDDDEAVPGLGPAFPVARSGVGADPMRMRAADMRAWYDHADQRWRGDDSDRWFARWLVALAGQAAVKDAKRGDVELTPFYAPTGQMTLRGSLFDATVDAAVRAEGPADAFVRWRRTSFDGANFDERAKRDAGVTTSGKAANQGAPSPTWLAVMGIRMFTMTDDGHTARTVGWQRVRMYPGYTFRSLVWPTWRPFLDPVAVRTLIAHPALELTGHPDDPSVGSTGTLTGLGVTAIFGASRRTLSQGDGPLGPARRLWSATPTDVRTGTV